MARGFVYLIAVVDVASRMVLAHKVAITMEACRVLGSNRRAVLARPTGPEIVQLPSIKIRPSRSLTSPGEFHSKVGCGSIDWLPALDTEGSKPRQSKTSSNDLFITSGSRR